MPDDVQDSQTSRVGPAPTIGAVGEFWKGRRGTIWVDRVAADDVLVLVSFLFTVEDESVQIFFSFITFERSHLILSSVIPHMPNFRSTSPAAFESS